MLKVSYFEFLAACTDNAQVVSKGYGKDALVPSRGYGKDDQVPSKGYGKDNQVPSRGYGKDDQVPSKGDWDTMEGEDYIGGGGGGGATWKPKPADGNF